MKKTTKQLCLILLLITFCWADLQGDKYSDPVNKFSDRVPSGWDVADTGKKKDLRLTNPSVYGEVAVEVFNLEPGQHNAQDVAKAHLIAYDSWEYVAGRRLGWNENHGAESGFSVMYTKRVMGKGAGETKIIAQEYYFVKAGKVYILTLLTDTEAWSSTKDSLLFALDNFFIE